MPKPGEAAQAALGATGGGVQHSPGRRSSAAAAVTQEAGPENAAMSWQCSVSCDGPTAEGATCPQTSMPSKLLFELSSARHGCCGVGAGKASGTSEPHSIGTALSAATSL